MVSLSMVRNMDSLFNELFYGGFPKETKPPLSVELDQDEKSGYIKNITVQVALAGFKKENLKIWYENSKLCLEGDNTADETVNGKFKTKFSWRFPVADTVDLDKSDVQFQDGLLTLKIPTKDPETNRKYLLS